MSITFQLGNKHRELTIEELNLILGYPTNGFYNSPSFKPNDLWGKMVCLDLERLWHYTSGRTMASALRIPTFRYIQQVLSFTFLTWENIGSVRADELLALKCMITGDLMDVRCDLTNQFLSQVALKRGVICVGGMGTPIAKHFGVHLGGEPISGDILIDLKLLKATR